MREIDLTSAQDFDKLPSHTFLLYGPSRTGKTTFIAGFPRPLVLADASEGGWGSIADLPEDQLFEPDVKPLVWAIESLADFAPMLERARPLIASGRVLSLHVDSISFYADLALNNIIAAQGKYDVRSAYGTLGNHLRDIRVKLHTLCPIASWTALARDPDEDHPAGGPMIPGAQGEKFGAGVSYIFYTRKEVPINPVQAAKTPPVYEKRTKQYGRYLAGSRLGGRADMLPDPFTGNYTELLTCLGYDVDKVRASLPKIGAKPVAVAAAVAKPPIAVAAVAKPAIKTVTVNNVKTY